MRKLFYSSTVLLVLWTMGGASATDLRGKFALSTEGGIAFAPSGGFSHKNQVKEAHEFGASVEYFFLSELSAGLEMAHTSFPGKRMTLSDYYGQCSYYLSTDWNWTKVSLFGRVLLAPGKRLSPFFKGGLGLYLPRVEDCIFCPSSDFYYGAPCPFAGIEHTRKTYGKGQFGYQVGFGIQYLFGNRVLFHSQMRFTNLFAEGLVIRWFDYPPGIWETHKVSENGHHFGMLAGVSFLFGPGK